MEIGAGTNVRKMAGSTMGGMAGRLRVRREAKRAGRLHEENDRLRAQLQVTRSELDHERDLEHEMLDVLTKAAEHTTKVTAKTKGGLLQMASVAAVAYVFGTKAGHERYEQMRTWLSEMKDRMADAGSSDDVDTSHPGLGPRPNPLMERGIRRA
jgi:Uri superfamily endonuclease